jgi:hypothetical protein
MVDGNFTKRQLLVGGDFIQVTAAGRRGFLPRDSRWLARISSKVQLLIGRDFIQGTAADWRGFHPGVSCWLTGISHRDSCW